ncbi:MAG: bifunctional methylenetetrahydrofolate dehydrogenase/methenyltetrahydrofolate cyclohydrolase [Caldiserica bacterium CG17_big_fil_post_rev_8_21_14_2_50_35_7]|jgi:methylenetetrahydrofolate dehydrogenase (NADP+)/methenyltetrahydrofolate cyclohydrolase|nr:bifunctional 5,10-methylenetetrahydrofolate dehydrogenase/5,10-methenyltetrahydrofolate cyclohydrolase [Caldisericota bacterium]PIW10247.1 MAG: bifunctional methylenetetrahydrofolate dehydrogenase/methenyltetrahydrofolate cyclohydrolase [Caldiserica bacterium CG17_big_fil_post_rev_8_21_14_2_50_35_7]
MIINGKEIASKIQEALINEVKQLKEKLITPSLTLIQVGEEKASLSYARSISKEAEILGIYLEHYKMPYETTEEELLLAIKRLNERRDINGIVIELPLPQGINKNLALEAISPEKDVDGFHPINMGRLLEGTAKFVPATAQSVLEAIKSVNPYIEGKNAVIIGRSNIVGKPTALLLLQENATVTICHSRTKNLQSISQTADILVVSTGRPHMIDKSYIKRGAIVIDVGITKINGKIIGDVDFDDVKDVAGWITPVPGGIGILTTLMLFKNTIKAAKIQNRISF